MSRKSRYVPMEVRISNLSNLVELNNIDSNDPVDITRFNALEESLAIIENREPILKVFPQKKNGLSKLFDKLSSKQPRFEVE